MIIISYLKPYNYLQIIDVWLEYLRTVCKLFVLDRNIWYHITVYNKNINLQSMQFLNLLALNNIRQVDMSLKSINQ